MDQKKEDTSPIHWENVKFFSCVPLVLFLYSFAYVTFIYEVVYRWLGLSIWGIFHFIIENITMVPLYHNYMLAVLTTPGFVPPDWRPTGSEIWNNIIESDSGESMVKEQISYCRKCDSLRPPRSHHCTDVQRCVLKFDHFCPWINNCVGYFNQKFFILFIFNITINTTYMMFFLIWRLLYGILTADMYKLTSENFNDLDLILTVTQLLILVTTNVSVSCLLGYQLNLVFQNTTNVERLEIKKAKRLHTQSQNSHEKFDERSIYDRGLVENFKQVFGNSWRDWITPTLPSGDGFEFPLAEKSVV